GELGNISVRLKVEDGDRLMVGGFIITGTEAKRVIVRAIGPSLLAAGLSQTLADPQIDLRDVNGSSVARNANWRETQASELLAAGLAPGSEVEPALVQTLGPGAYTAQVTAEAGGSGVGVLEIYEADQTSASRLANISTRGVVGSGDEVMIGGFIARGPGRVRVLVRAIGPSLAQHGISGALADPSIEIRDSNSALIATNADWADTEEAEIQATSLAPANAQEAAAIITVAPGAYTVIVRGSGGTTGIGLIEVYRL
ncbi:MAG TPA: hypothetical protein VG095_04845, partial [Chthoniobacterales bacterium]|nr:hypothetical protein [Chthoniobacterales bacterium]